MKAYFAEHPRALVAVAVLLMGFSLYNLLGSVELYHRARGFADQVDRAASEALGG